MLFQEILNKLLSKDNDRIVRINKGPVWDFKVQEGQLRLIHGHDKEWTNESPVTLEDLVQEVGDITDIEVVEEESLQEITGLTESSRFITLSI